MGLKSTQAEGRIFDTPQAEMVAVFFYLCYNSHIAIKEVFSMLADNSVGTAGEVPAK